MPSWPMAMPSSTAMVLNSLAHTACRFDLARNQLPHVLQVDVAGHELGEAVDHRDDGPEIGVLHAGGTPQGTAPAMLRWRWRVLER